MYQIIPISLFHSTSFGSAINARSYSSGAYRYGFNGKELDKESFTDAYDFGARIYDGRLGRWLSLDPLMINFSDESPYDFCFNSVLYFVDNDGNAPIPTFIPWLAKKAASGAVISSLTEVSFQLIDIYMSDMDIEFSDALSLIDLNEVGYEALNGAKDGIFDPFGKGPTAKFNQLFQGKYRKVTMYIVKQSISSVIEMVNQGLKKHNSGYEINTDEVISIIGNVVGSKVANEILGASLDKGLLKTLEKTKKKYNKHIDNVIELKDKQKDLSKKLSENPRNKKINRQLQNNASKIKKERDKAVNELKKQYERMNGGKITIELIERSINITEKNINKREGGNKKQPGKIEVIQVIEDN